MDLETLRKRIFDSEDDSAKKQFSQELLMDGFTDKLHDINFHGSKDVDGLKELAEKIDLLSDWPENQEKFWDLEAAFWYRRIDDTTKNMISKEIAENTSGKILNIGSGSVPYTDSVNVDLSFEMLNWNPSINKVQADALSLPFKDNSFDSAVALFVANYITDLDLFVSEIKRVLNKNSALIIVQGRSIHPLHKLAENKYFSITSLAGLLRRYGFSVRQIEKENLIFLRCKRVI
jgi:SAM-dependent methyltransferase